MEEQIYSSPDGSFTSQEFDGMEWDGLMQRCRENQEKLNLAGEYGLRLSEELAQSHAYMEEMRLEHEAQVEKMIQENYELKNRLRMLEKSLQDHKQEYKKTLEDHNISRERFRSESSQEKYTLKESNMASRGELEKAHLRESHMKEEMIQLVEKISTLTVEKQKKREVLNTSYSEELFCLNEKVYSLEDILENVNSEVVGHKNENEKLLLAYQTKEKELENAKTELEEAEVRNTGVFNHLQKSREEAGEIKAELDALKMQIKKRGHSLKGNSLFGEVEDERIMMEKKLITMEVKSQSVQKAYAFLKTQHHNLKSQVTALLSLHSAKADSDHIGNLERALSQAKAEIVELLSKLRKNENLNKEMDNLKQIGQNLPDFNTNKEMVNFLQIKLKEENSQKRKLSMELEQVYMCKMAESDKLNIAEQKLHDLGILSEKYRNENMKLRLRLEETKNKLEAETQKRCLIEKKFNYDSTNDVEPIGIPKENKAKSPLPFTLTNHGEQTKPKTVRKQQGRTERGRHQGNRGTLLPDVKLSDVLKKLKEDAQKKQAAEKAEEGLLSVKKHDDTVADVKPEKDRKVSFKEGVEVLASDKHNGGAEGLLSEKKHDDTVADVEPPCLKKTNSRKKIKANFTNAPKEKYIFKSTHVHLEEDPDCKVQ